MNPDSAVEPTIARGRGEPEVAKTPRHAVSKSFSPFSLWMVYRVFGREQALLIDVRSEAEPIGVATKGLLLASASG